MSSWRWWFPEVKCRNCNYSSVKVNSVYNFIILSRSEFVKLHMFERFTWLRVSIVCVICMSTFLLNKKHLLFRRLCTRVHNYANIISCIGIIYILCCHTWSIISLTSEVPSRFLPPLSWKRSHFAISSAFVAIPPGALVVVLNALQ